MGESLEKYSLEREEEVIKYWKENDIQEIIRQESLKKEENFYFMDGPP